MLNGIAPIILFNFKVKPTSALAQGLAEIPVLADVVDAVGLPPIPIYLDERLTGIYIDSENKNIEIETSVETLTDGAEPKITQKGINSVVTINMLASRDSLGVTLLAAMCDLIFQKVTSEEYSITYLHGAVTVFGGLLHSFSINQNSDNDLYNISLQITRAKGSTLVSSAVPLVSKVAGAIP